MIPRRAAVGAPCSTRAMTLAVLALALASSPAASQRAVQVRTSVSETTLLVGGSLEYTVTVESEGRDAVDISPAALPRGLVVTGQSESTSLDIRLPGGVTRIQTLTLSVLARTPGTHTIPGPGVRVGGTLVRGGEEAVTVVGGEAGATTRPPPGADDIGIRAFLAEDTVYVGEPVELTTEVLLSDAARRRLRGAPQYFPPTPAGFLIHDLGNGARRFATGADGRRFEVQRFRRAFVPLEPGSYRIPAARVELDLRRSLFDPAFPDAVESEQPVLVVLPLPASGRPDGFQGAVGRYDVDARLDPSTTAAGDAVRLEVVVRGRGYVKPLPAPALTPADGLDLLSPRENADIQSLNTGLAGEKTFSWIVVAERPGVFELPEVRYPYFDPDVGRYAVARSAPLRLEVRGAPAGGTLRTATLAGPATAPGPGRLTRLVASPWFGAARAAPVLAFAAALLALVGGARRKPASTSDLAQRTETLLKHWAYADAQERNASLRRWLADRLDEPQLRGATAEAVATAVREAGATGGQARALEALFATLDATRYGRSGDVALDGDVGRALIRDLHAVLPTPAADPADTERRRARIRRTGVAILAVGLALAAAAAAVTSRNDAPGSHFVSGLDALGAGETGRAAAHFAGALRDRPEDSAAWYNLGLAEARSGRTGRAVWASLNALRRAPSFDRAAENARALGTHEAAIGRARGRPPLAPSALVLLATLALYLAAAATLAASRPGTGPRWRLAGAGALMAALVLLVAGVVRGAGKELLVPLEAVALRYEPARAGEAAQVLKPGVALVEEERRPGWVRVRIVSRATDPLLEGWVPAGSVASVSDAVAP